MVSASNDENSRRRFRVNPRLPRAAGRLPGRSPKVWRRGSQAPSRGGDRGGSQGTWPQRTPFGGRLLLVVQSDAKVQRASAIFADCCTLAPAEDLLRGRQRDLPSLPLNLRVVVAAYDGPVAIDAEAGR
jgi:hypothetical protein